MHLGQVDPPFVQRFFEVAALGDGRRVRFGEVAWVFLFRPVLGLEPRQLLLKARLPTFQFFASGARYRLLALDPRTRRPHPLQPAALLGFGVLSTVERGGGAFTRFAQLGHARFDVAGADVRRDGWFEGLQAPGFRRGGLRSSEQRRPALVQPLKALLRHAQVASARLQFGRRGAVALLAGVALGARGNRALAQVGQTAAAIGQRGLELAAPLVQCADLVQ